MALNRRGSDGGDNSELRGVQSINPIGDDTEIGADGETSSNYFMDLGRTVAGGVSGKAKALMAGAAGAGAGVFLGVQKMAGFMNLPTRVVGAMAAVAVVTTGAGGAVVLGQQAHSNFLIRQEDTGDESNCAEEIDAMIAPSGPQTSLDEVATKVLSVGRAMGLSDMQVAGMLGNAEVESGIDPTTLEGIYDEPFSVAGPRKSQAVRDLDAYCVSSLFPSYASSRPDISLNLEGYRGRDGKYICGLGIFQFTGVGASDLVSYAQSGGIEWYDIDAQLAFSFDTTGGWEDRAKWLENWGKAGSSSPSAAAIEFARHFEGNTTVAQGERQEKAVAWYQRIVNGEIHEDKAYAESIVTMANTLAGGSLSVAVTDAIEECAGAQKAYDNSNIARAAVAFAWETTDRGRGNDGTALYQYLLTSIVPNPVLFQSCDASASTAIHWAGADDAFPSFSTSAQDAYLAANPTKWQHVGELGRGVNYEDLMPGDVLITTASRRGSGHGHITLYVGQDMVREKYPNSNASIVSASFGERSPGCEVYYPSSYIGEGYYVYRNIKTEDNSAYSTLGQGLNLADR